MKHDNHYCKQQANYQMRPFSELLIMSPSLDIHAIAGRERCQRRVGTGEGSRHDAEHKEVGGYMEERRSMLNI
jgi:hypothetical protein